MTEMENERKRSFARVRGVGYRMVQAVEHGDLARQQHRKAKRRLKAAHRKAHSADRSLLTQEERQRIDARVATRRPTPRSCPTASTGSPPCWRSTASRTRRPRHNP